MTDSEKTAEIEQLKAKAQRQLKGVLLTTPAGNNAYETYQALAKIAPDQAAPILNEIVAWYFDRGKTLIERNDLIYPAKRNAYEMYTRMQSVAPQHTDSKAFSEILLTALEKQAWQIGQTAGEQCPRNLSNYGCYRARA